MKKLISVVMACILLGCCFAPANVNAAILWTNIDSVNVSMQSVDTTGYVAISISTTSEDADVSVDATLYVKATSGKWIEVTPSDWTTQSGIGESVQFGYIYSGIANARYKVDITVTVTVDGYTETTTTSAERQLHD